MVGVKGFVEMEELHQHADKTVCHQRPIEKEGKQKSLPEPHIVMQNILKWTPGVSYSDALCKMHMK